MADNFDGTVNLDRARAYLQLCGIAYDSDIEAMSGQITDRSTITNWEDGKWQCVWGPVLNKDHGNLALIAKFEPQNIASPPTYVVVIRGTDISEKPDHWWSDGYQLDEDVWIGERKTFPGSNPADNILIAHGTMVGWTSIDQLSYVYANISQFLLNALSRAEGPTPTVALTGHSLGGCLTTAYALSLADTLQQSGHQVEITPYTFAGPTAGNQAFADQYDKTFPRAARFHNVIDVIPHWWAGLDAIPHLYSFDDYPLVAEAFFDYMKHEIAKMPDQPYVQPRNGDVPLNSDQFLRDDWIQQAKAQHHWTHYLDLLQKLINDQRGT